MTTDPAVTVVFFSVAFLAACAAGAGWEHWAEWRHADLERRAERIRQRDAWALIARIEEYTQLPRVPDTVPVEWEEAA